MTSKMNPSVSIFTLSAEFLQLFESFWEVHGLILDDEALCSGTVYMNIDLPLKSLVFCLTNEQISKKYNSL